MQTITVFIDFIKRCYYSKFRKMHKNSLTLKTNIINYKTWVSIVWYAMLQNASELTLFEIKVYLHRDAIIV